MGGYEEEAEAMVEAEKEADQISLFPAETRSKSRRRRCGQILGSISGTELRKLHAVCSFP